MTQRSHHSTDLSAEIVWLRTLSFECPSPHPVPSMDVQNNLISLAHTRTKVCLKRTTARPFPFHSLLCSTWKYQDFLNTACCCPHTMLMCPTDMAAKQFLGRQEVDLEVHSCSPTLRNQQSGSSANSGIHFMECGHPHSFLHCPWLLFHYNGRVEKRQQKSHDPQCGKCLLPGPSQKEFAVTC